MNTQTKAQVIANVQSSIGSLFTKEDVIAIINHIAEPEPQVIKSQIDIKVIERIKDRIQNKFNSISCDDVIDVGSTEFGIQCNSIYLESADVYSDNLTEIVHDIIDEECDALLDEQEETENN